MVILINALSARRGGGQTYLLNLLSNLEGFKGSHIYILAPDSLELPTHPKIKRLYIYCPKENPLLRTFWEFFFLPGLLRKVGADVLFCPGGLINTVVPKGCRTVTMFRNMVPFDPIQRIKYPLGLMRMRNWLLERAMTKSLINADLVIFVSAYARRVIEKRVGSCLKNSVTIQHGLNNSFKFNGSHLPNRPKWLPREEYLLYVSTFDVYRNQLEVVRGFNLFKQKNSTHDKLVLVGHNSSTYGKKVVREINRLELHNDVILTGSIPYNEMPNVYRHAKVNIYASECENCPNILLECLGAGRPMVASNRQPMPEFSGDAAVYFDPSSPKDLADKLTYVINNPIVMDDLAKRAREHSLRYDWRETARRSWRAIESL